MILPLSKMVKYIGQQCQKLYRPKLKIGLASGSGTVVEHSAHYAEVKGTSLTTVALTKMS